MIVSDDILINIDLPITNQKIENELSKLGLNVIRWAISKIDGNKIELQISYIKQNII